MAPAIMLLVYQMPVGALNAARRILLADHVSLCFQRPFPSSRMGEFSVAVVCQKAGRIVGLALLREEGEMPTLECVSVLPGERGAGMGSELVKFAQQDLGHRALRLHVDRTDNPMYTRSCRWYERLGFCKVAEDEKECEMRWCME